MIWCLPNLWSKQWVDGWITPFLDDLSGGGRWIAVRRVVDVLVEIELGLPHRDTHYTSHWADYQSVVFSHVKCYRSRLVLSNDNVTVGV